MTNNSNASIAIDTSSVHSSLQYNALRLALSLRKVGAFIEAHRRYGYRIANLDPLGLQPAPQIPELTAQFHAIDDADVALWAAEMHQDVLSIEALDAQLKNTYCGPIGLDSSAMRDESRRQWLIEQMESAQLMPFSAAQSAALLRRLTHAEEWELNVQKFYPKAKRFSLEGCESLLPLMDTLVEMAGKHGLGKLFLGMPHRGRLNLLVNLMDVPAGNILAHFEPDVASTTPEYDLPYHLGCSTVKEAAGGKLALTLAHNPSHLQSVYPVVLGMARACQDEQDFPESRCAPIIIHGDAAFAGQGVVMEALKLGQHRGYSVQGTVHIIVNNQIGFTTPNPLDASAHVYCTDISRIIDAPVLHVNADQPEAVIRAARIAFDYRMRFGVDIIIDLIGYRRWGHAEQDTAEVTQPQLHALIDQHPRVTALYRKAVPTACSDQDSAHWRAEALSLFQRTATLVDSQTAAPPAIPAKPLARSDFQALMASMTTLPAQFRPHDVIVQLIKKWRDYVADDARPVDWCFAENMAYASLLSDGNRIRVSGMDVGRGTFMHRHAVWHSQEEGPAGGIAFVPLQRIAGDRATFDIFNSPLTEEAILGFEYGFSVATKAYKLPIWEAQFGDFVNGAQIMVDQYISSGEQKWGYQSALTMMLPHGYEGVGPEHSTAYLSRFLQLCADQNIRVVYPSDSAQWFHLLREQATAAQRKPLVVMAPKAKLYANPSSFAPLGELIDGRFQALLADPAAPSAATVTRVVLSSGKLFYDLQAERDAAPQVTTALLRVERLYPFPEEELAAELARFDRLTEVVWAQEEDKNQGAWHFVREHLENVLPTGVSLRHVCRAATASGARASVTQHLAGQRELVASALS
ncbi:2-oxoglutarate dehydrogenase E1 component [Herbaspirillum sp. RV1423]|uniref:2-oxoglutarate dehydrogenase E1 component n=1 Tax=Herbaspirillum sp. RV1423 TaxID=1443993 RepID=UPI0005564EED|nr:2-oxoglutarate dehydrogenase E1 component [Herbaspirillum sp. RV1423]